MKLLSQNMRAICNTGIPEPFSDCEYLLVLSDSLSLIASKLLQMKRCANHKTLLLHFAHLLEAVPKG